MGVQSKPSAKRKTNSFVVRQLYGAVQCINSQRQAANLTRICKYMQRHNILSETDCINHLTWCVKEGLLGVVQSVGKKGTKKNVKHEKYVVPRYVKDSHDWYCFMCHASGPVICCSGCHRVFHTKCFKGMSARKILCYVCESRNNGCEIEKEKLNHLLGFLCKYVKDLVPEPLRNWKRMEVDESLMNALIYKQMDWFLMQQKVIKREYSHSQEFRADAQNFLHNVIIYYGTANPFTKQVKQMFDYCEHDIKELEMCVDCYEASNCKEDMYWFCKPCNPPHKLVYAKLKTYPYWPAKVIGKKDGAYDVRFFGAQHTRALIPESRVISIESGLKETKKLANSRSLAKAQDELKTHLMMLSPQVKLERLPNDFSALDLLNAAHPENMRHGMKRKGEDSLGMKKSKLATSSSEVRTAEEIPNSYQSSVSNDQQHEVTISLEMEQETIQKSSSVNPSQNTVSDSELEVCSLSENFHTEIHIKEEYEASSSDAVTTEENLNSSQSSYISNEQQPQVNSNWHSELGIPKLELLSVDLTQNVTIELETSLPPENNVHKEVHIKEECVDPHEVRNDLNQNTTDQDSVQCSESIPDIIAESHICKEEEWPGCDEGYMMKEEAEEITGEAVAVVNMRYENLIARLEDDYLKTSIKLQERATVRSNEIEMAKELKQRFQRQNFFDLHPNSTLGRVMNPQTPEEIAEGNRISRIVKAFGFEMMRKREAMESRGADTLPRILRNTSFHTYNRMKR